jgi:hypothetical protein
MSTTVTHPGEAPRHLSPLARLSERRLAVGATALITVGSLLVLMVLQGVHHTTGGEIDGIIVAALGVVTGGLSLAFLAIPGRHRIVLGVLVALWVAVALGGIGGYADHAKAVTAASADQRARPALAPLVFAAFGLVGAAALIVGRRRD